MIALPPPKKSVAQRTVPQKEPAARMFSVPQKRAVEPAQVTAALPEVAGLAGIQDLHQDLTGGRLSR